MNIARILTLAAKKHAQKPAIIFKDQLITFDQLGDSVFRLANSLIGLGVKKGDRVAIYLPNCPEYVYSYLAVWSIGATCVPLDFMLTQEESATCIAHCEAKILIAKPKAAFSLEALKAQCPSLSHVIICDEKNTTGFSLASLLENVTRDFQPIEVGDADYAIIFYTSGTTGKPKGVLVNYRQLGAAPEAMEFFVDLNEKDITLCALPFSHSGGLVYIQNCIFYGVTVVLMERFIPLEFLKYIQKSKITCFWVVPSMYYALLQLREFETFDLSSLRWIVSFGASNSPEALRRFNQYCPKAQLLNGWGLTETNAPTVVIPLGSKKIESVGRPAPWIEVKIVDDNDAELSHGQIGEIVVRGWVVTDGYYKDPQATQAAIRKGWFHTGDLGRFDADGDLYIVGRKKEMIKVAGEIVFEPEVEAAIHKYPGVAEVAVVGAPDKLRGEVPRAFVVAKEGQNLTKEDLQYFCRQHLAHYKIPHHFEFVQELPKNRAGKIDKEKLRSI